MRRLRRCHFWRSFPRRAGLLALLGLYLTTVTGLPLPAAADGSPPSPCGCSAPAPAEPGCCGCCHSGSSCCGKARTCCASSGRRAGGAAGWNWVGGAASQKCRGASSVWVSLGAVLPAPAAAGVLRPEPRGDCIHPADESQIPRPHTPPVPPPRAA